MEKKKPLILISNDDGVWAKGIKELIRFLRPLGEIVVMAPDAARSGSGCALSVTRPVCYEWLSEEPGVKVFSCNGTPVDCIKLACSAVLDREPDLIAGGINHGDNSGSNVHYSGTMGLVIEGCLKGIPSIGFSLCDHTPDADFRPLETYVRRITSVVLEYGLPSRTCLNVNFPRGEIKGVRVCEQAIGQWQKEWEPCPRGGGSNHFWLTGEFINTEPDNEKSDNWALANGYVAITPTTVDLTDYPFIDILKERL
ncbi:MAG: 5'/3'-nucleotidase SurE [Mediterranea sp.]|jgi:5'-nucleotidase|nr:5'/3'-nucleotidase SurE [Mediterranea sp.]